MKRNYLYKQATYNVTLKNFQDEFLRNMIFNLYNNGSVSLSNSKDFFDEGVSTEAENKAILGDIYNLLINTENRSIELLGDGEVENVTVSLNEHKQDAGKQDAGKQDADKQDAGKQDAGKQDVENKDAEKKDVNKQDVDKKDVNKQDADKQDADKQDADKKDVEEKPVKKKRGRPKSSKINTKR